MYHPRRNKKCVKMFKVFTDAVEHVCSSWTENKINMSTMNRSQSWGGILIFLAVITFLKSLIRRGLTLHMRFKLHCSLRVSNDITNHIIMLKSTCTLLKNNDDERNSDEGWTRQTKSCKKVYTVRQTFTNQNNNIESVRKVFGNKFVRHMYF